MKQSPLLTAFIIIAYAGFCRTGPLQIKNRFSVNCYAGRSTTDLFHAREMLTQIMNVVGLTPNFELKEAKVDNIEASISHRKRYILYNPDFINWINNITNDKWAALALMAHEVGHHLNGHTIKRKGSTPKLELEADEFAGFVLYKLGASLQQAQEVMKYIAKTIASSTHPSRDSRMLAIENGWNKAAGTGAGIARSNSDKRKL